MDISLYCIVLYRLGLGCFPWHRELTPTSKTQTTTQITSVIDLNKVTVGLHELNKNKHCVCSTSKKDKDKHFLLLFEGDLCSIFKNINKICLVVLCFCVFFGFVGILAVGWGMLHVVAVGVIFVSSFFFA